MSHSRLPLLDAMKGIGCLAIVLHHLAVYGPMSEVVRGEFPALIMALELYARLAVQMFFVLAGFLVAAQLAPDGHARKLALATRDKTASSSVVALLFKRYRRLITPFLFALASAILITALVRPWFVHDSLSAAPSALQLLAHAFLLHDLTGVEALSAGVWYVAIDFQLFMATVLLTALTARVSLSWRWLFPCLIMLLAAGSLWVVNRHNAYEDYAPYFFGAYALGMMAYWSTKPALGNTAFTVAASLGALALWLEYRNPIVVALATSVIVSIAGQYGWLERWPKAGALTWLGQRSYSIFLIHYGFCIGMNALWSRLFPTGVLLNALGMLLAVAISIWAGSMLYKYVESQPTVLGRNWLTGVLTGAVAAAFLIETLTW